MCEVSSCMMSCVGLSQPQRDLRNSPGALGHTCNPGSPHMSERYLPHCVSGAGRTQPPTEALGAE